MRGCVPFHYKRLSCGFDEAMRLARIGAAQMLAAFNVQLYFTQSVISGAMLSGDYDTVVVVTPSQYGKSWLLGHVAPLMAFHHQRLTVAAATANTTEIIMTYIRQSVRTATPDIKQAILGETMKKIDRLDASMSKLRISFADGGSIDAITLGDSFGDNAAHNKAVGRGGGYIVDEAAMCSEEALGEIGRRELSSVDGNKDMLVMISNPHKPGVFYDYLTEEHLDDRTIVIWMDALTATQEGRWSAQHVLDSDFAKREDTRSRYWMCELPRSGVGMFDDVRVGSPNQVGLRFMGIDAAYKGKDNICLAMCSQGQGVSVDEILTIKSTPWIDGKTSEDICDTIAKIYHQTDCLFANVDVGYGVWIIEGLIRRGVNCMGVNFAASPTKERVKMRHYAAVNALNTRAEMHLDLQGLIEDQSITFAPEAYKQVKDVLPYIACDRKSNGKIVVRPKVEIKNMIGKSPDELDAVLLAIHALILYGMYDVAFIA